MSQLCSTSLILGVALAVTQSSRVVPASYRTTRSSGPKSGKTARRAKQKFSKKARQQARRRA